MKYKIFLLMLSFAITIVGCKKDNKDNSNPNSVAVIKQKIVGSWELEKTVVTGYDETGKIVKTRENNDSIELFEFFANGSAKSKDEGGSLEYQYNLTAEGNKTYINLVRNSTDTFEIAIDNNAMTWAIEELTPNSDYAKVREVYYFKRK